MITDEELIERVQTSLRAEAADVQLPTNLLAKLRDELAHDEHGPARPGRRLSPPSSGLTRRPRWGVRRFAGRVLTAAVVVVSLVIAGGAVILFGGHRRPVTSPAVSGRQQLIDIIGVLRRPQTKADLAGEQLPPFRYPGSFGLDGIPDRRLVRYATTTPWGERLYFVALRPTAKQVASYSRPQLRSLFRDRPETLGVFSQSGYDGGGTAATIEAHGGLETEGAGRNFNEGSTATRLILVVPDGVAKVTFVLSRQPDRGNPYAPTYAHSLDVSVPVHDNIAAVQVDRDCCSGRPPMVWYGPAGQVIKRIGNPASANRIIPPPKPGPETPLSRAAQRNPATANRLWVTPSVGGPHSDYTVHFHVLLNYADYDYRISRPPGGCSTVGLKTGGGLFTTRGTDLRGTTWSDPLGAPRGSHGTWCAGTYRISVAVLGLKPNGDFEYLARPFGTATFTVRP